jgi:TetR/AcrR family transcriptional repressor of uid operon
VRKVDPTKHEAKRHEILMAAGRCFERGGFQGATISDICAEAKMSPGHLYHYFASKEAIVGAMVQAHLAMAARRAQTTAAAADPIGALIEGLVLAIGGHGPAQRSLLLEMLAEAGRNPVIAQIIQDHSRFIRGLLVSSIKDGQKQGRLDPRLDPDIAAAILMSMVDGAKIMAIRHSDLDAEKKVRMVRVLIERFLAPRPEDGAASILGG